MLDAFVAAEGEPEAIQLSGGEPSIHPQILDMLAAAKARGIKLVMLNTNGIRLARDPRFARATAEIGVHVFLQFDGFEDSTQLAIRGQLLHEESCARSNAVPRRGWAYRWQRPSSAASTTTRWARSFGSASSTLP
jgi:uncharacterized radical SAM superfamily Fe-S cluster-containing enzyme